MWRKNQCVVHAYSHTDYYCVYYRGVNDRIFELI